MSTSLLQKGAASPPAADTVEISMPTTAAAATLATMDLDTLQRTVEEQEVQHLPPAPRPTLQRVPAVMDDFIRNFLLRNDMRATLECFEQEWYGQAGAQPSPSAPLVPDNYMECASLLNRIEVLERDLRQHAEVTTRLTQQWAQAKKDRDFHRTSHQRVVQEKSRLARLLKQAGTQVEQTSPALTESRQRCEQLLKAKSLLTIERDRLAQQNDTLQKRVEELEHRLSEYLSASPPPAGVADGSRTAAAGADTHGTKGKKKATVEGQTGNGTMKEIQSTASTTGKFVWPLDERPRPSAPLSQSAGNALPTAWGEADSFAAHGMPVTSLALHPFKPVVATASEDGHWRLSTLPRGEVVASGRGHRNWISNIGLHPRGTMLATASGDATLRLWDFGTSGCAGVLKGHTDGVWSLHFQETGHLIASAALDKTARVWEVETGQCRQVLRGHVGAVHAVRWVPYTNLLLTGSADKTVSVWDARMGSRVHTFDGHGAAVLAVATGMSGEKAVTADTAGVVKLWDLRGKCEALTVDCGPHAANDVAISRSEAFVAVASDDGSVKMIDLADGVVEELTGHEGAVQCVEFDPAGEKYLVSGGSDKTVRYWSS